MGTHATHTSQKESPEQAGLLVRFLQTCYSEFPTPKQKQRSSSGPNEDTVDLIPDFVCISYAFLIYTYKRQDRKKSCACEVEEWSTTRLRSSALQKMSFEQVQTHVYQIKCALTSIVAQFTLLWSYDIVCQAYLVSEASGWHEELPEQKMNFGQVSGNASKLLDLSYQLEVK